ncbi:peptidase T. Metallo peptidase. MEROPS family M20B [Lishizhenia tianjinensis]|uniref:Peptidase T n=1 Tax=Lishizhenia tianjinensis TaxID=477690 RepID=A0A1I6Y666_9FLAO|nr:peptidase T [Lishizhenia tianjinensis]SFT46049.1 peptidase T. Metallo peptidase. MEROPS family M20B [Lishizhenia tianjinensis]
MDTIGVAERLMKYVQVDTEADPTSETFPSTMKQKDLAEILVQELKDLGIEDAYMDEWGYVFATIPSNTTKKVPTICFCAHMDTAPDVTGKNVKPILHKNYDGSPIVLPDDNSQVITTDRHPYLKEKIGDDLITASGLTLLGADDKAGVACIMDFAEHLMKDPSVVHGDIRILFTPDEEVGRGVDKLDMDKLNADYGYTLDGGVLGSIEDESFSADAVTVKIQGISAHPGYAKNKMVNALKLASEFIDALPKDAWSPETTSGREGFVHPVAVNGAMEECTVQFIIRDHETSKLAEYEARLEAIVKEVVEKYAGCSYTFEVKEQYRNMKEVLKTVPFVTNYAIEAMENVGVTPKNVIIRGGTDGSRLSFMGLPCPNIFTGEMAIHSRHEYVSVQDMEKAVATMKELVQIWERNAE